MLSISSSTHCEPLEVRCRAPSSTVEAPRPVVLDVALVERFLLTGVAQLEAGVLPHRLVQPVAGDASDVLFRHQRLVDQRRQHVQGLAGRLVAVRTDRLDVLQGEPAREHAQAPQQRLLAAGQQIVAPVDGRAQRLLARQGRPASPGEQGEPVGQPIEDLLSGEDAGPNGGELDRQRQPVEPAAQLGDGRLVRRRSARTRPMRRAARSANSMTASFCRSWASGAPPSAGGRSSGGTGTTCSPGTCSGSRLVAITRTPRRGAQDLGHEPGGGLEHVLAVVHDQQQLAVPQVGQQQDRSGSRRRPGPAGPAPP